MKLQFLPLASPLHEAASVAETLGRACARLEEMGITPSVGGPGARALLVLTGGTEGDALRTGEGPCLLIAHPFHNSLPAAMEIKARLDLEGVPSALAFLDGEPVGAARTLPLARMFLALQGLRGKRLGIVGAPSDWGAVETSEPRGGLCRTQLTVRLSQAAALLERPLGNHHIVWPGNHLDRWRALESFGWRRA